MIKEISTKVLPRREAFLISGSDEAMLFKKCKYIALDAQSIPPNIIGYYLYAYVKPPRYVESIQHQDVWWKGWEDPAHIYVKLDSLTLEEAVDLLCDTDEEKTYYTLRGQLSTKETLIQLNHD